MGVRLRRKSKKKVHNMCVKIKCSALGRITTSLGSYIADITKNIKILIRFYNFWPIIALFWQGGVASWLTIWKFEVCEVHVHTCYRRAYIHIQAFTRLVLLQQAPLSKIITLIMKPKPMSDTLTNVRPSKPNCAPWHNSNCGIKFFCLKKFWIRKFGWVIHLSVFFIVI